MSCFRCNDQVKLSQYLDLAHSLEIDKAIGYLRQKDFQQVIASVTPNLVLVYFH